MRVTISNIFSTVAIVTSLVTIASAQTSDPLPSANDVVAQMLQRDTKRQSELRGYTAIRRYVAVNKNRRAEMAVRVECSLDGSKRFSILSEEGSGSIRKHVFHKLLKEEREASLRGTRNSTRLTPDNYHFEMVGQETLESGPAYVLAVVPKNVNKYLIDGKIWVDATDYSIVRIEGQPARNPSFWVRNVHFLHTYQKVGQFWLAASTDSTSDVRIFGLSELTIDNSEYALNPPKDHTGDTEASLLQ